MINNDNSVVLSRAKEQGSDFLDFERVLPVQEFIHAFLAKITQDTNDKRVVTSEEVAKLADSMNFNAEGFLAEYSNILAPPIISFLQNIAWATRYGDSSASGLMDTGHQEKTIFHKKVVRSFSIYPDQLYSGKHSVEVNTTEALRLACIVDVLRGQNLLPSAGNITAEGQSYSIVQRMSQHEPPHEVDLMFHHRIGAWNSPYPKYIKYSGNMEGPGRVLNDRAMRVRDAHIVLGGDLPQVEAEFDQGTSRSNVWKLPDPYDHATQMPIAYESSHEVIPTGVLKRDRQGRIIEGSHLVSMQFSSHTGVSRDLMVQIYRTNKNEALKNAERFDLHYPSLPVHVMIAYPRKRAGDLGVMTEEKWRDTIEKQIAEYYEALARILTVEKVEPLSRTRRISKKSR